MPDENRKLPALGWAGFEDSRAAAGRRRRKATWSLRPMHEASDGATVDASRFLKARDLCAGLGRKPVEE
jgi:hypothetical protein